MTLTSNTSEAELKINAFSYKKFISELDCAEGNVKRTNSIIDARLKQLIDPGTYFLELSRYAGHELYDVASPGGGILTGIGQVSGKACMILINNPEVKAGCYFPITIKKTLRALEVAKQEKLPCLYLVDSGGAFLPMQAELFADRDGFGRIFYEQSQLSKSGISQYAAILRPCTAGGAYVPLMADACIMLKDSAALFLAGPNLVEAAIGEKTNVQDLGGSKTHCRESGVVHQEASSEAEAITWIRNRVSFTSAKSFDYRAQANLDITGFIPKDLRFLPDMDGILSAILDNQEYDEYQPSFGISIRTGFGRVFGSDLAVIANDGILDSRAIIKLTSFLQECEQNHIPILFLHNTHGMMVGSEAEKSGIARHGANLLKTLSNLETKKYTIMIGNSYGAGNYVMCGRAYNPNFLFQWPNNKIGIMGTAQQEFILKDIGKHAITDIEQHKALYHSARLLDDGIIMPNETRNILGFLLKIGVNK